MHLRQWFDIAFLRLRSLFGRGRVERELRFHLDRETEANLRLGLSPPEARLAALRRLGGMAHVQEECRDMRRTGYIENFVRDLQYAARTLLQSPGFAFAIVLTLALSIGATSAIFTVVDGVLLRPLPYPQPGRPRRNGAGNRRRVGAGTRSVEPALSSQRDRSSHFFGSLRGNHRHCRDCLLHSRAAGHGRRSYDGAARGVRSAAWR